MASQWLPEGGHYDLNIEHYKAPATGPYVRAGLKVVWHITVSPWFAVDSMRRVLISKGAYPQLLIGGRAGYKYPVVIQFLPLDQWGKALVHPAGTPETNKAGCVQVEICATVGNSLRTFEGENTDLFHLPDVELPDEILRAAAKAENGSESHAEGALEDVELCMAEDSMQRVFHSGVAAWTDDTYKALANLTALINHRQPVPLRMARRFGNTNRFSPGAFVTASGHCGHMHVPGNYHYDPTTAFRGWKLMKYTKTAPNNLRVAA